MTYRVKDSNKNILAEHELYQDFATYVSQSQADNEDLQFFEYDVDLYERIESGSLVTDSTSIDLIRITYAPNQDDIV